MLVIGCTIYIYNINIHVLERYIRSISGVSISDDVVGCNKNYNMLSLSAIEFKCHLSPIFCSF